MCFFLRRAMLQGKTVKTASHPTSCETITQPAGEVERSSHAVCHREHNAKTRRKEMRFLQSTGFAVMAFCSLASLIVPGARADEWNKMTKLTFNQPVQVPGVTLPAGTYVFKLADSEGDRTIVQIFNENQTKLITTILAIPDYRMKTPGKTIISFDERPTGQPEALRAWFYPGDNFGVEFVYPKQKATELAKANQRPVLSTREELTDAPSMKNATVEPVAPPPLGLADGSQSPSLATTQEEVARPTELPKTASPIPAIAFAGILLLAAACGIRRLSLGCK